jgi:hypothetical protein
MVDMRSPICAAAGLAIFVVAASAQSSTPLKMLDDVRDRRYCEFFVVKRQGAGLTAGIYNTLGLNDCPQATWDAIDIAKVASQFGAIRVIRNGPRHFIMDRLASGDVTKDTVDIQGLAMRQPSEAPQRLAIPQPHADCRSRRTGERRGAYHSGRPAEHVPAIAKPVDVDRWR